MKSAIGNTRLVIQCFTDGGAFNETRDLYQTRSDKQMTFKGNAAYSGTSSMEGEYEGQASGAGSGRVTQNRTTSIIYGQSGFYPSEIKVTLNGSIYTPDADKILFDNEIRPGTYEVVASFREGSWDAYSQVQHKGRRYQKTFRVNVQKNEVVFLDLLFVYDGTNSDIQAKVQQR